jgi:Zn-dependent protease
LKCDYCGREEVLPFVCNYCNGTFCPDHRLPEAHQCVGDLSRRPVVEPSTSTFTWSDGATGAPGISVGHSFSAHEVRDIIIAWLGLGIAFSIVFTGGLISGFSGHLTVQQGNNTIVFSPLTVLAVALVTVGLGFVLHELMHKFVSERYGFRAEFRMWPQGLVLALFLATFTGFVFAAPGATYIDGYGLRTRENGIISLAGPLTNVVISVLFLPVYLAGLYSGNATLFVAGYLGSYINVFLAAFNMLPIMPLDGAKVWRWHKPIWIVVFLPLAGLVLAYLGGYLSVI